MTLTWAGGLKWSSVSRAWLGLCVSLPDGRVLVRHELTWRGRTPEAAALETREFCEARHIDLTYVAADPRLFPQADAHGETISETFLQAGIPLISGDDDRLNGWSRIRSWLEPRPWPHPDRPAELIIQPSLLIHPDCQALIRSLPMLVSQKRDPDDVEEGPDEYPASGLRYYLMSRPRPTAEPEPELPPDAIGHWVRELREAATPDQAGEWWQ
jgi:hypothetical protein